MVIKNPDISASNPSSIQNLMSRVSSDVEISEELNIPLSAVYAQRLEKFERDKRNEATADSKQFLSLLIAYEKEESLADFFPEIEDNPYVQLSRFLYSYPQGRTSKQIIRQRVNILQPQETRVITGKLRIMMSRGVVYIIPRDINRYALNERGRQLCNKLDDGYT